MMKLVIFFLAISISFSSYSNDYRCVTEYLDKKLVFAFNDGDIDYLRFSQNPYGVVTVNYFSSGREAIRGIKVHCHNFSNEIFLFSDQSSPVGPYKDPVEIYLPNDIVSGHSEAKVDLRWGRYYVPYPKVFIE